MKIDPRPSTAVSSQPYPLLFVTVSGAHLYGFPSPDSDYDLRGVHVLPACEVVGLDPGRETIEIDEGTVHPSGRLPSNTPEGYLKSGQG